MLFNSFDFMIFFPVVLAVYFALPFRFRWIFLLAASYYFYAVWNVAYLSLLVLSSITDYVAGVMISRNSTKLGRTKWLILSLVVNFGVLFIFKYYNFFTTNLNDLLGFCAVDTRLPESTLLLPLGISFYTFQEVSYTIDVYRGRIQAEKHPGYFALYVCYFPQLVAGPIERATNLLHQLREPHVFNYDRVTSGLRIMAWGFFQKVIIADRLAVVVSSIYNEPHGKGGPALAIATVAFAFQIFCDFSGYSLIAIGAAKAMGVDLMKNFDCPYHSQSIPEFWRRWHISLSTWFRDYLYIPLGGNRVAVPRWYFNLMMVFIISGIWHGANWTFLIWGVLHGIYMVLSLSLGKWPERMFGAVGLGGSPRVQALVKVAFTFSLVCLAWVFFRARSVSEAWYIISHLGSGWNVLADFAAASKVVNSLGLKTYDIVVVGVALVLMEAVHLAERRVSLGELFARQPTMVRWSIYYATVFALFHFGVFGRQQFIYFQF